MIQGIYYGFFIISFVRGYAPQSNLIVNHQHEMSLRKSAGHERSKQRRYYISSSMILASGPKAIDSHQFYCRTENEKCCIPSSLSHNNQQQKSRRKFLKAATAFFSSASAFQPSASFAKLSSSSNDSLNMEPSSKDQMNNIDPFASFGETLNQMDFGNLESGDDKSINGGKTTENDESGKNLNDVIQEKKKQRGVDPRTHG